MLYYRNLPVIKTVTAPHDFVLAEIGYPIARHPFNFFIDEVLDPSVDMSKSFYSKHWPNDDLETMTNRIRMCQAKVVEQDGFNGSEPIDVMVNDVGQFVILDGNHRACIQLRFNGGMIRMHVRYISKVWEQVVEHVNRNRDADPHGKLYQEIDHPYFQDYPFHRGAGRAVALVDSMKKTERSNNFAFDIGCNTGLFSRHFATEGFFPFGFEICPDNTRLCETLSRAARLKGYYFHEPNVLNVLKTYQENSIGAVICVSVLHHYLWKGDMDTFLEYVKQVSRVGSVAYIDDETDQDHRRGYYQEGMFPDGPFMEGVFGDLGLKHEKIHTCSIGRTIYRVTK